MPKREDTTRQGFKPIPQSCPHGHWIGLHCSECDKQKLKIVFKKVVWPNN